MGRLCDAYVVIAWSAWSGYTHSRSPFLINLILYDVHNADHTDHTDQHQQRRMSDVFELV